MRSSENARNPFRSCPMSRSRLHALPDHIAHDEAELAVLEPNRIEPVAADRDSNGAGKVASGELHALDPRQRGWGGHFAGGFRRSTARTRKRSRDRVPGRPVPRALRRIAAPQRTVRYLSAQDMTRQAVRTAAGHQRHVQEGLVLGELHDLGNPGYGESHVLERLVERRHAPLHRPVAGRRLVERNLPSRVDAPVRVPTPGQELNEPAFFENDSERSCPMRQSAAPISSTNTFAMSVRVSALERAAVMCWSRSERRRKTSSASKSRLVPGPARTARRPTAAIAAGRPRAPADDGR